MATVSSAAPQGISTASTATAKSGSLASLSSNFNDFLGLLMTQLRNQDPTSPLDTNQFTSQLVQFSSVEQQIAANTSLTQLVQLTQNNALLQSSAMVGKSVVVASDHLPLQQGQGSLQYTAAAAQPVSIQVLNSAGAVVRGVDVTSTTGTNTWTWDGKDDAGNRLPDGSYKVAVTSTGTTGTSSALPFTVSGTVTGATNLNNAVQIQLGALSVGLGSVQRVGN